MRKYRTDESVKNLIDYIQRRYACCGNFHYSEWFKVDWKISMSEHLTGFPSACCDKVEAELRGVTCISEVDYRDLGRLVPIQTGCLEPVRWWYYMLFLISAILFGVAALAQLVSFGIAVLLAGQEASAPTTDEQKRALMQQTAIYNVAKGMGTRI
ncbi:hypothetical protein HELRODRAFT_189013 [Helobdella robusta]|uniref:Tetraspanin n=1 Tax=Helobdella robusta TaxID=6412 RepID=T1FQK2_HELRO|nr:hypothetical protein HELRODRAFT_189013 [Helobdella robusta]ESN99161.1 hypothetical protein HELRODRAFT_189013 [Helobdella robusta]